MQLPQVSLEILGATTATLEDNPNHWNETMDKLLVENPLLYELVLVTANGQQDEQYIKGYQRGALLIYTLLASQSEANEMNQEWWNDE